MDSLIQDLRYAFRGLLKSPGFTTVALLTLGLGIGANTAIFSVFDTVLLRPLPYRDADRLYVIHEVIPAIATRMPLTPVNAFHFREWRTTTKSFEEMGLLAPMSYTLTGNGDPIRVDAARATPSLFRTLSVEPALGRGFREDEDVPGRDGVVILGHELWTTQFGADPSVIGKTVRVDGTPNVIVGVMPSGFNLTRLADLYNFPLDLGRPRLWKPFAAGPRDLAPLGSFNHIAIGCLRRGASPVHALEELNTIQADLARHAPEPSEFRAALVPMADQITGKSRAALQLALGTVALVLLIACVNVTNLLLARGGRRQAEFAIRRATGATRFRLMRQLLVESLVLSGAAGLLGVVSAAGFVQLIQLYAPVEVPRIDEVALGGRGLLFAFALTFAAGLLIGILPAWRSTEAVSMDLLRAWTATGARGPTAGRLRSLLVGAEVAAGAVVLIVGALFVTSFFKLMTVDRGFNADHLLTVDLALPTTRYDTPVKGIQFLNTLAERARSLPGVISVGVTDRLPLSGPSNSAIMIEGTSLPRLQRPVAMIRSSDRHYLRSLGTQLRAGRLLDEADSARRVAVITTLAASRLWPQQEALGKRFRFGPDTSPFIEVVGIVDDVRGVSLSADPPLIIYVPFSVSFYNIAAVVVRTTSDPARTSAAIREIIRALDAELAVTAIRTMDDIVAESVAERRFQMNLALLLGVVAAFLVGLGIYGVVSQAVIQRTSEFGVRIALGADGGTIQRLVLGQGLRPVAAGIVVGIVAAIAIGRLMRALLFAVSPTDVMPFIVGSLFLGSVAAFACLIPAWRASRMDPLAALRYQ